MLTICVLAPAADYGGLSLPGTQQHAGAIQEKQSGNPRRSTQTEKALTAMQQWEGDCGVNHRNYEGEAAVCL